ncbi:GNAT family N-acetyltransferase [Rubrimonas cliftonensis]|uniref:Acetyltransferase (GNAT) family protein n=1 Tax=Rubrimonas cliftonensis TaxID=89524 RepID=A0A1H3W595_9RHOB|nr:GNAT family N-acetyltransferase [Rubrimonas cliftonensis]SDZ81604.1 Acetyltransferase (GNAT) family protein [Rubrimonas cliftonensis]
MRIGRVFSPGAIGDVVALHGRHYAEHWGFGAFFEAKVARELAGFVARLEPDDLCLIAADGEGLCGSLILDLHDPASKGRGAHLRWFIVADRARGTGLGGRLMSEAMAHVDACAGGAAWLTTFAGLDAARRLYERRGFALAVEADGAAWGVTVREQEFRRGFAAKKGGPGGAAR